MNKYICDACKSSCEITVSTNSCTPKCCPYNMIWKAVNWNKAAENLQDKPLPKLTDAVFYRPDCPLWAVYAAVDKYGSAFFYEMKPSLNTASQKPCIWFSGKAGRIKQIPGKWDASDWQHSLIEIKPITYCIRKSTHYALESAVNELQAKMKERSAELPDWCKVGEWVYDHHQQGYEKIIAIEDGSRYCIKTKNKGFFTVYYATENFAPARLRPYNAEEMKALMGKVIEKGPSMHIVTGFENVFDSECMVHVNGCLYGANDLLRQFTIDGKPCGVLEHIKNGEWVE